MNLLRTELRKLFPYRTFWIILATYILLLFLLVYASSGIQINGSTLGPSTYQYPELWSKLTYVGHFFNLLLGILIIILITDEYNFRTFRQQVIDGLSKFELILAKFYLILGLAACSTLYILALGLYFGLTYSTDTSGEAVFSQIDNLSYFFVQAVAYMTLAMLFGFLIRKSGLAIIAFIAYTAVVEPIIHYNLNDTLDQYFPMKVLSSLTPMPGQEVVDQFTSATMMLSPQWAALLSIVYIGLFIGLAYLILKLRDL